MKVVELQFKRGTRYPRLTEKNVLVFHLNITNVLLEDRIDESVFNADEKKRLAKFHFKRDASVFAATRSVLKQLLAHYLKVSALSLSFEYTPQGKPLLPGQQIDFNVSHSGEHAMIALTLGKRVGVDIETLDRNPEILEVARRFFSNAEYQALQALTGEAQKHAFFQCWTQKEAFVKAIGKGLSFPLKQFDVAVKPDEPFGLQAIVAEGFCAEDWLMRELSAPAGYMAALAVDLA